jgi:hypothetical protein
LLNKISSVENVLAPSKDTDWMSKSVAFQKFVDGWLFFSAESSAGEWRIAKGRLTGDRLEDCGLLEFDRDLKFRHVLTPSVMKTDGGYVMAFAVESGKFPTRRLLFATAETLKDPWRLSGTGYSPRFRWEGRRIDLGPGSFVYNGDCYFFYSSVYPRYSELALKLLRSPTVPSNNNLRRFVRRRIGMLKLNLGTMEASPADSEPLLFDCSDRKKCESVFCPGYVKLDGTHLLFVATSNYSMGYPFQQGLFCCESPQAPLQWDGVMPLVEILGDKDLPAGYGSPASFDTPDPVPLGGRVMDLYFSAAPRASSSWSIFKCKIELRKD